MTDNANADTLNDFFRILGVGFNKGIYFLLGLMYQIFFNVASAQLFETETIKNFYGRIQLIIGVFMIFKLAVSILKGIMEPDKFMSPKEGFGNLITRIIIALALLTVLVPINIPDVENANSYEKYLNNNGLLFGTLYSLQDRILSTNTLGRLILGTTDDSLDNTNQEDSDGMSEAEKQTEKLQKSSRIFTSTILKGFLRINLLPAEARKDDSETNKENWYCNGNLNEEAGAAILAYQQLDVDPSVLLSSDVVTSDCEINDSILSTIANGFSNIPLIGGVFENIGGKSRYVFVFDWIWCLIIGGVFLFILIGFTVDIAIRSIKLAILRLIAPIPAISYIDPKSSKDGMFASWVKALTSTYLDLFLRLAIVYFVIFLIQDMIVNGIIINEASGMVGIISCIFIWIGLFFFAKMAPKFIKDALGIKGAGMTNVGLAGMLGGAATFVGGGSVKGALASTLSNMGAASEAAAQGKQAPSALQTGSNLAAQIKTGDPKAKGGLVNSINDRLMRDAGVNRARKLYGVTANGLSQAKQFMNNSQNEASVAEDLYNRFINGHSSDAELSAWARKNGATYDSARGTISDRNGVVKTARKALYDDMSSKQISAAKAKSHYEDAKKFADSHRVTPSFEDEHRWSLRERVGLGDNGRYRADYHPASGRSTAHQTLTDRIAGSPEDWDKTGSRRSDNRWDPNKFNSTDTNAMHENPHADIGTPRAGGRP